MANEPVRPAKLAVLIDAENASPRIAAALFKEVAAIGEASVRRIYGDFSNPFLKGWADILSTHAIVPQQTFANTIGKNASDIALVIDAMELLHGGGLDGFCIVSSDSDFTRLALKLRERGADVYGFGEQKTPTSFRHACRRFICTSTFVPDDDVRAVPASMSERLAPMDAPTKRSPSAAISSIRDVLAQLDGSSGWYPLGVVGKNLATRTPAFDPRAYGCSKLLPLIEKSKAFDIRREDLAVYIRPKADA